MKANELRIDNIVNRKFLNPSPTGLQTCFTDCKIKAIGIEKVIYECKDKSLTKVDFDKTYPIPLTEEWLLKFGFVGKYKSVHTHWNYKGFGIEQKSDEDDYGASIPTEQVFYYDYKYDIKYVHQLQNLYFALTGEELTLKTT